MKDTDTMDVGAVLRLSVVLCGVVDCCAMNNELTSFANDPVTFFQNHTKRYNWISDDMKQILCQLPSFAQAKEKIAKWRAGRQPEKEIDLSLVKARVKEFYKTLLQGNGDVKKYLIDVAEKAIDKTEFTHAKKIVNAASCLYAISHGLDDVPPYLRITEPPESGIVYLEPNANLSTEQNEAEKASYYEKLARELYPKYDDKYEAKYVGLKYVGKNLWEEGVEFRKKPRKICENQPDFKEIDSNRMAVPESSIMEAIQEEVMEAAELLFMNDTNVATAKYKFGDPSDQQKYEAWLAKIQSRFMVPEKITDNYCVRVSYISTADAEAFLIHEIAHILERAWWLKTETKTENSNPELFSLYMETTLDYSKTVRLWEIYRTLVFNCLADFLLKKPNLTDIQQSMQSLEELQLCDYEAIAEYLAMEDDIRDVAIKRYFQYEDFSDHIYALYNAIKLHEQKLSVIEVLQKIATERPIKLTPQNFKELVDYLMK